MELSDYIRNKISLSNEIFDLVKKTSNLLSSKDSKILESKEYLDSRILPFYQKKYQFGYFPPTDYFSFFSKSNIQTLQKINVLFKKDIGYDCLFKHHTIVFPILDDYGYAVGLIARTIDDEFCKENNISKYKYSTFHKSFILFGLNFAKEAILTKKSAILVEGQFDKIACDYIGQHNVVATGGISLNYYQLFLLKKYGAKKIYLLFDNDDPGQKASYKILKKFEEYSEFDKIVIPSKYHDIDEYIKLSKNTNNSIFDAL